MLGTITRIGYAENMRMPKESWHSFDGYRIETTEKTYCVGISNSQNCCETWGIITSEDLPGDFVGATLLGFEQVDQWLMSRPVDPDEHPEYISPSEAIFVNVKTDRGTFQITLYNIHNGYYGHAVMLWAQSPVEVILDSGI